MFWQNVTKPEKRIREIMGLIGGVISILYYCNKLGFQALFWIISPVKWLSLIASFSQHYLTRISQTKLTPALIGAFAGEIV